MQTVNTAEEKENDSVIMIYSESLSIIIIFIVEHVVEQVKYNFLFSFHFPNRMGKKKEKSEQLSSDDYYFILFFYYKAYIRYFCNTKGKQLNSREGLKVNRVSVIQLSNIQRIVNSAMGRENENNNNI